MRGASSWRFNMDFKEMKDRIKLIDVLRHYGITLRRKIGEEYASAACPLPTHPSGDQTIMHLGFTFHPTGGNASIPNAGARMASGTNGATASTWS